MVIVMAGSYFLADPVDLESGTSWKQLATHPGVRDRMLAVALTASASVFLKRAIPGQSPWTVLAVWCLLGWLFSIVTGYTAIKILHFRLSRRQDSAGESDSAPVERIGVWRSEFRSLAVSKKVFWSACATLAMQCLTIILFSRMPVGYALALFQLGSIVSVYLGHRIFGETRVWRRLLASLIMIAGAIAIIAAPPG